jgi:hypothetical protein
VVKIQVVIIFLLTLHKDEKHVFQGKNGLGAVMGGCIVENPFFCLQGIPCNIR